MHFGLLGELVENGDRHDRPDVPDPGAAVLRSGNRDCSVPVEAPGKLPFEVYAIMDSSTEQKEP